MAENSCHLWNKLNGLTFFWRKLFMPYSSKADKGRHSLLDHSLWGKQIITAFSPHTHLQITKNSNKQIVNESLFIHIHFFKIQETVIVPREKEKALSRCNHSHFRNMKSHDVRWLTSVLLAIKKQVIPLPVLSQESDKMGETYRAAHGLCFLRQVFCFERQFR